MTHILSIIVTAAQTFANFLKTQQNWEPISKDEFDEIFNGLYKGDYW